MKNSYECPNCGASVIEAQQACIYCGSANPYFVKKISYESKPSVIKPIQNNINNNDTKDSCKNKKAIVVAIIIIVILLYALISC